MGFFPRIPVAFATAMVSAIAGLSTPYSAAVAGNANHVPAASPGARAQTTPAMPTSLSGKRLDAVAAAMDRITRQLRVSANDLPTGAETLAVAADVRAQLASLDSLELVLDQSAIEDRSEMARMHVPSELRERYETNQRLLGQRLQAFRRVANRVRPALGSRNAGEASSALSQLRSQLAASDVTRRLAFDPATVRAQQVKPEHRAPAGTRVGLERFLAPRVQGASMLASTRAVDVPPELAETPETALTPEITALAASLGHNPVQIFNWVHNNIDFVPTHGAIQGAGLTLANRRGNAADTNSLLAALLRASGIPTRFVYGTVDVPVAQALNWLKAGDVDSATHATQVGGIPTTLLKLDGQIKALRFQHLWVEANIDFTPSRGAINRQADAWTSGLPPCWALRWPVAPPAISAEHRRSDPSIGALVLRRVAI
jgi:hypothetical protein